MSEALPGGVPEDFAAMRREVIAYGRPIHDELQHVITMPHIGLTQRIRTFAAEHPERIEAVAPTYALDEIPVSVHDLPPDLYDHTDEPSRPYIPDTDEGVDELISGFWPAHQMLHALTPGFHLHATQPAFRENLIETLKRRRSGPEIDLADWRKYQDARQAQLDREFYTLGHNATVMSMPAI